MKLSKTIRAQQECLKSITEAGELADSFCEWMIGHKLAESAEVSIEPWNNGYRGTISIDTDWDCPLDRYREISFQIEPDTFFDKRFEEGEAKINYSVPFAKGMKHKVFSSKVENDKDIEGTCEGFVILVKWGLRMIEKEVL